MKFVILFVIIGTLIAASQGQLVQGNPLYTGQPGCQTEEELSVALWPHFRNKRAYWICTVEGQPAALELCPIGQGFLAAERACVPWIDWYWTPTIAPPSSPISPPTANAAAAAAAAGEDQQPAN